MKMSLQLVAKRLSSNHEDFLRQTKRAEYIEQGTQTFVINSVNRTLKISMNGYDDDDDGDGDTHSLFSCCESALVFSA